ncbi:MAG: hypothetical protein RLY31_1308 [Bacteroidota bacterium]
MKSKIVLWGSNAQDEKVLVAIALQPDTSRIEGLVFPEATASEDFYQQMIREWRDGDGMELPEPADRFEKELSLTERMLPEGYRVEREDVLSRAQTEWQFIVLSGKLHQAYESRLEELKTKIDALGKFDQQVWNELKEFWDKVQDQVKEKNLLRDHANRLRDQANQLFGSMKELRTKLDQEFEQMSRETYDQFIRLLDAVEKKVETSTRANAIFDELKRLQQQYRDAKMTREHRNKVWEKLDATFKYVKEKRFGGGRSGTESDSALQRLKSRYDGLISAIEKMDASIRRDRDDLHFQEHKISITAGQLEAQIRQAKIVMIKERIRSKEEKLAEMNQTKTELEKRLASMQEKENRRAARDAAKEKIAGDIKAAAESRDAEGDATAESAVEPDADGTSGADDHGAPPQETLLDALEATLGDSLADMVDTVKAVANVVGEKVEEKMEELREKALGAMEQMSADAAPAAETPQDKASEAEAPSTEDTVGADVAESSDAPAADAEPDAAAAEEPVTDEPAAEPDAAPTDKTTD